MKNPNGISITRDSDIYKSEWPAVPPGFVEGLARRYQIEGIELDGGELNLATASLVLAKVHLFNARLRVARAIKHNEGNEKVALRLKSLEADLKEIEKRFPLEVMGRRKVKREAAGTVAAA